MDFIETRTSWLSENILDMALTSDVRRAVDSATASTLLSTDSGMAGPPA